jgi:excisionase family DNA binding protein
MPKPAEEAFLTVTEVAAELGMTRDGVYKLVRRGKLKAVRRSERQIYVSRLALAAYRRRLAGEAPDTTLLAGEMSFAELLSRFKSDTGRAPGEWLEDWKADRIEDSPENARRAVRAVALHAHSAEDLGAAPDAWSDEVVRAAFADLASPARRRASAG